MIERFQLSCLSEKKNQHQQTLAIYNIHWVERKHQTTWKIICDAMWGISLTWCKMQIFCFLWILIEKNTRNWMAQGAAHSEQNSQRYSCLKLWKTGNFFVIKNYFCLFRNFLFEPVGLIFHFVSHLRINYLLPSE